MIYVLQGGCLAAFSLYLSTTDRELKQLYCLFAVLAVGAPLLILWGAR